MDTQNRLRFRKDVLVTVNPSSQAGDSQRYLVKEPESGATFEFGEEEFFLCQAFDGLSTLGEITARFQERFGISLSSEDYKQFLSQINTLGLLETWDPRNFDEGAIAPEGTTPPHPTPLVGSVSPVAPAHPLDAADLDHESWQDGSPDTWPKGVQKVTPNGTQNGAPNRTQDDDSGITDLDDEEKIDVNSRDRYRFTLLKNPQPLFDFLLSICRPLRPLFLLGVWGLIPGFPIALFTYLKNQDLVWQDIAQRPALTFFEAVILSLLTINLLIRTSKGIVARYYDLQLLEMGIRLRFGIIPRWYLAAKGGQRLHRNEQLWYFGTSSLVRLHLFVIGVFLWQFTRGSSTQLAIWSISFAKIALFTFIILSLPILPRDGYRWFVTFFRLPQNLWQQAAQVAIRILNRRPIPKISPGLLIYSLILLPVWAFIIVRVLLKNSIRLAANFPEIFGQATFFIAFCVFFFLIFQWLSPRLSKLIMRDKAKPATLEDHDDLGYITPASLGVPQASQPKQPSKWTRRIWTFLILAGVALLLSLPFPYRPGGFIQLLPPAQLEVQAPISGRVSQVFFAGGDGQLVKAGQVIATITSTDLENNILTLQEQVRAAQANLEREQANLAQILAGPTPESVEVARKQVAVARQEVEVARQRIAEAQAQIGIQYSEIDAALVTLEYGNEEVKRLQQLVDQGAYSLQQLETARERAESAAATVEVKRGELAVAQQGLAEQQQILVTAEKSLEEAQAHLQLVSRGVSPDVVEAAQKNVEAAQAEVRRIQQEFTYAQNRNQSANLFMPLDGQIVDAYLKQKAGTYVDQGETFALVQDSRTLLGEMEIPEYDAGEITVGTRTEVKLLAYPNMPLSGSVVSIEPITTEEEYGLVFKALIEFTNTEGNLKPGMSGYGKIDAGEKPLFILLTRPLMRFLQIEIWSWLP